FKYKWLAGSPKTSLNEPYQLVITSDRAKVYFPGMPYNQVLGKTVIFDSIKTTVTGIVQMPVQNTDFYFQDFISYSTGLNNADLKGNLQLTEWGSTTSASSLFIKLADNVNPGNVEKQLNALLKKHNPPRKEDAGNKQLFHLQPLSDLHFNQNYSNFDNGRLANKTTLYGLLVIAAFLLVLGCINFVNLTTAQASQRAKEIGIRKTMGSTRNQLIGQFLSETFVVTVLAVIIAMCLAPVVLKLFSDFIPKGITIDYTHQYSLLLFLLVLIVVVTNLSGFYPALVLSAYKPVLVLKNQAQPASGKTRNAVLRKSLTVMQFIIAQFFIMATILVSKQIYYALHKDLGFKKDAIVNITIPFKNMNAGLKQVFKNKLESIPQIELMSIGGAPPSSGNINSSEVGYKDGKKEIKTDLQFKAGDENYLKVYNIKLLAGRNLRQSDSSKALLINNTYLKILGFKSPSDVIGKMLDYNDKKYEVIGVVADFYQRSIHAPIKPLAIVIPQAKYQQRTFHIALKPQTPGGNEWKKAVGSIEKAWKQLYPEEDFDFHFFDADIAKFYDQEQHTSTLLTWATGLSIFISCLGLLGLAMYTTNLRTKEIGVRKVLGASVAQIVRLLSTELVLLIVLAFVIVTPLAWYAMNKWMENFADRTAISWWIFVVSGAGMLLAALFTLSFQTVKAAIANPVKSLRSE
ncbi:MAG TPA: FtsX-like permease family protein, partial [Mucilaginibacter sp.]